jgi:lysophospholipase L1-like esterase
MKRFFMTVAVLAGLVYVAVIFAQQQVGGAGPATAPATADGRGARGGRGFAPIPPGPPAPVPPEVAIARPSPDEITKMNDELARLIDSDSSDAKPLFEKYRSLLTVTAPRPNIAATFTQTPQRLGARHLGFVAQAKAGGIDLLFEGDSITDWWTMNGPNAYQKYFGDMKVANFAIAGDTTQGVLWGLKNGEGQGFQPKAIMMMIGTNNTGVNTAEEIAEGIGAIVLENRKDFPDAKILLLAVFPRGLPTDANRPKIAQINKIISRLDDHQHVFYMDIGSKFLDDKGVFLAGAFRSDNLHPQELGYDIWGSAVKDTLVDLMK